MSDLSFMFSNWYSGATLLSILLNSNSKLICNGEAFQFDHGDIQKDSYRCSCGEALPECQFYGTVAGHFWSDGGRNADYFRVLPELSDNSFSNKIVCSYSRFPLLRDLFIRSNRPIRRRLDKYLGLHRRFYENARKMSGADCYIDGTKSIRRAELFQLYGGVKFSVVYLVRDGRAFAWSYLRNHRMEKPQLAEAAQAWLSYVRQVDSFCKRYPAIPVHVVRYEDLCRNLEPTLRKCSEFLGVPFDAAMLSPPVEHHVLGNQIRHTFNGTVRESLSWHNKLTDTEQRQLESIMHDELARFGYL